MRNGDAQKGAKAESILFFTETPMMLFGVDNFSVKTGKLLEQRLLPAAQVSGCANVKDNDLVAVFSSLERRNTFSRQPY